MRGPLHGAGPVRVLIPQPAMFAVVCVLWAAVFWVPVSLHHRGNTILLFFEEVPLLLGLVFLSPTLLVLASLVAVAFIFVILRRQAFYKAYFNLATGALGAAAAATVFREILGAHSAAGFWGWVAGVPALCVAALITT